MTTISTEQISRRLSKLETVAITFVLLGFGFIATWLLSEGARLYRITMTTNALLAVFLLALLIDKQGKGKKWDFSIFMRPPNLVQACVQASVYLFISQYSPHIGYYLTIIVYQLFFAITLDLLLSLWFYGHARFGVSVFPIVLSINLFLWFRPLYLNYQLLTVAMGVASKYLFTREWGGKRTHIFNPSAIAMALASVIVLYFGVRQYVRLDEITDSYTSSRPHVFLWVASAGLLSQWVGRVLPIPAGALLTLFTVSQLSEVLFGVAVINRWLDPAVFVGVTLLITDPASSPRTNLGKFYFGCLYGLGIIVCYAALTWLHLPGYFAKILSVPILNIIAPRLDRFQIPERLRKPLLPFGRRYVQALAYAVIFFLVVPAIPVDRTPSLIGVWLGGWGWARELDR